MLSLEQQAQANVTVTEFITLEMDYAVKKCASTGTLIDQPLGGG